ncbi:N-acetyltransferase [Pseudodonghicola xiamenensis]|uniref:N-acetyltransferase n=2 Tax=Pseudodonghicola xiamenensis TaxID=337702 RepID=A0A8J3H940_9RHOB|nr:N-acetyltransferase [Pseudodonghicola xiamenensis]
MSHWVKQQINSGLSRDTALNYKYSISRMLKTMSDDDLQPEAAEGCLILDNYRATAHKITTADRHLLHELTISVFWPHRDRDLDLFISLGQGYVAVDEIGRAMGSAMYFPMGDDFAMFGMMVTAPRLQMQGAGRWLLNRIMSDCAGRDLRLSATRAAYWLYEGAGFVPVNTIWQHQGKARRIHSPEPVAGVDVRPMTGADIPAILALDLLALGADRSDTLKVLIGLSEGLVAVRGDQVLGYALKRPFGRGKVIGPVIVDDERVAMQLIAPFIQADVGNFLRVDTPVQSDHFAAFLAAAGLGAYDTVTEMRIGPQRRATEGPRVFGMASHSLG